MSTSSALPQPVARRQSARSEHHRLRVSASRWSVILATLFGLLMIAAICELLIDASEGSSPLIPYSPDISSWLSGIGEPLGYRTFLIALLVFTGCYAGIVTLYRRLSVRWIVALIVLLQVMVFTGPILFSTDVFSYIAYARMGIDHGVNPYLYGAFSIRHDPIYEFVGSEWRDTATAYGPLYTLLSYPLALLDLVGAVWAMKAMALVASLGTITLTWHCAGRRGLDRKLAVAIVGLNPLWVIYGLGGAHNDFLMMLCMMGAVALTLSGREARGAAMVVAGTMIKATLGVMLPLMLLGSDLKQLRPSSDVAGCDRDVYGEEHLNTGESSAGVQPVAEGRDPGTSRSWRRPALAQRLAVIVGAVCALAAGELVAYIVFGSSGVDLISALNRDSALVSIDAFPVEFAHLLGKPGVFPIDHELLKGLLVLIVLNLLWRTWRGYDWVAASGWALLAIVVTSTWLLPWYALWSLPLAVIVRDRRLLVATLVVQGLFIIHQLTPMFAAAASVKG